MDIDPWGDFEKISQSMGGTTAVASEDDDYTISDDVGIMPLVDVTNPSWQLRMSGFAGRGHDDDSDVWDGVPVLDTAVYPYTATGNSRFVAFTTSTKRTKPVVSQIPVSQNANWIGRGFTLNGDPEITIECTLEVGDGTFYFDILDWEETPDCSSIQLIDANFNLNWQIKHYQSPLSNSGSPQTLNPQRFSTASNLPLVSDVHLIVNGQDMGEISSEIVNSATSSQFNARVSIPDALIKFDKQLVRSVSFAFHVNRCFYDSYLDQLGGFAIFPYQSSDTVSDSFRIYTGAAEGAENTGLLKSIIAFLQSIVDGIIQLPGKIATAIIDGIKSLFIPDEDFIVQWKSDFFTMLETKFGFIYQCFQMLGNFFDEFVLQWGSATDYVFKFPTVEFTVQGITYTVIQEQEVSFDNPAMDIIRPFIGTFVSIIVVLGFVHSMEEMFVAIISGWSYFSYLKRDGGDTTREEENNS